MKLDKKIIRQAVLDMALYGDRISLILRGIASLDIADMKVAFEVLKMPTAKNYLNREVNGVLQMKALEKYDQSEYDILIRCLDKFKEIQEIIDEYEVDK